MSKFVSIRHLPKQGFVAYLHHDDGREDGLFHLDKQCLLARIESLKKSGLEWDAEQEALRSIKRAEAKKGRSILSMMANPQKRT